jgi:hypothetical protein
MSMRRKILAAIPVASILDGNQSSASGRPVTLHSSQGLSKPGFRASAHETNETFAHIEKCREPTEQATVKGISQGGKSVLRSVQSLWRQYQHRHRPVGPDQRAREQAQRLAERRAQLSLEQFEFIDTRPQIFRSEAFAEDLAEAQDPVQQNFRSRASATQPLTIPL